MMINFAIIGAGWRTEFYLRIAALCPKKFNITGMYIRNPERAKEISKKFNVKISDSLESLIETKPDFFVSCVNKESMLDEIELLCNQGLAVLSETPMGTSLEQIEKFEKRINPQWKVQVAEQFHFQPRNQAIKKIIESGILGEVHQVQLSCCHDYHAVSLIRYFLDIGNEIPKIKSITLNDSVNRYNSRNGIINPELVSSKQKIAVLSYKDKTAIYDFNIEQYFSEIRSSRILIRGTKGEIVNNTCTYLEDTSPIKFTLSRNYCGVNESLDGMYLDCITGNGKILYKNSFQKARLTDEEIAIAVCLEKMKEYTETNKSFYCIEEAITDSKTSVLM